MTTDKAVDRVGHASARTVWALIAVETGCFLGSEIARFAVAVWIYQATRSVYAFEALLLANVVPGIVVSPVAGVVVDRCSRKLVMIGSATIALSGTLIVLAGASFGVLSMGTIVAGAILASIGETFQWLALAATVPLLATEEDLPRYNGFLESGRAAAMLAGPVIGGASFAFLGLRGLLCVEVCTFVLATVVVGVLAIPAPQKEDEDEEESEGLVADSLFGLKWIYRHKPLLKFLGVAVFANFFLSIGMVVMPPYCLSILDERSYGLASGAFGGGMIVGGLVYGPLAKRFKNAQLFLWTAVALGALYGAFGFARGLFSLGGVDFVVAVLMTVGNSAILTVWQVKVPEQLSGRVLSAVHMVAAATDPLAYLLAGPLAERLFPYLFSPSSHFSPWLTRIWGATKSGELGAFFTAMGVVLFLGFLASLSVRDVREVEERPV